MVRAAGDGSRTTGRGSSGCRRGFAELRAQGDAPVFVATHELLWKTQKCLENTEVPARCVLESEEAWLEMAWHHLRTTLGPTVEKHVFV